MFFFFFKQKTAYEMRISDWSSDVCSSDLDDVGQHREVIEDEGEDADVEDFPDQPAEDVGLAVHGPEQAGQRDVDGDEDGGEKRDVAGQQPEPAIDVADEGPHEAADDVEVAHIAFLPAIGRAHV